MIDKPLAPIPEALRKLLRFGDQKQIRALKEWRKTEDALQEHQRALDAEELKCFRVEITFRGTTTCYVIAPDYLEAESLAVELCDEPDTYDDIEVDSDEAPGYERQAMNWLEKD